MDPMGTWRCPKSLWFFHHNQRFWMAPCRGRTALFSIARPSLSQGEVEVILKRAGIEELMESWDWRMKMKMLLHLQYHPISIYLVYFILYIISEFSLFICHFSVICRELCWELCWTHAGKYPLMWYHMGSRVEPRWPQEMLMQKEESRSLQPGPFSTHHALGFVVTRLFLGSVKTHDSSEKINTQQHFSPFVWRCLVQVLYGS